MGRFIIKHITNMKPEFPNKSGNNNIIENKSVMTTNEKVAMAQSILNGADAPSTVKRVKKDKGLIERTESSKTILTEDNKELLND